MSLSSAGFARNPLNDYPTAPDADFPNRQVWADPDSVLGPNYVTTFPSQSSKKVFFPPSAPRYGAALTSGRNLPVGDRSSEPPETLGDYVGEFFYPALSTRLTGGRLDKKLDRQLAVYRANRAGLLNELQNELVVVQAADPATRESELRAFAALQTPRIVALEAEADQLREQLINPTLLRESVDWSKDRRWKANAESFPRLSWLVTLAEYQVLRAAAYYQKGLSPEQRGMLCEITEAKKVGPGVGRATGGPDAADAGLFFSPEMAQLVPPPMSPGLRERLNAYTRTREMLKAELRAAVIAQDSIARSTRDETLGKLAESQWPHLAELAREAEEIRRELNALPAPAPPPLPPQIPLDLASQMEECRAEKAALDRELAERTRTVGNLPPFNLGVSAIPAAALKNQIQDRLADRRDRLWQAQEEFQRENADRYDALARKIQAVSAALREFAQAHLDPDTHQPMELKGLLRRLAASDRYFDQIAREEVLYKDYRIAMLEPGLSPEQRRLLFSAARVALSQALPPGEPFPSGKFPRSNR